MRAHALAVMVVTTVLAPVLLLTATACGTGAQVCAGQCGPPFQAVVIFRPGTTRQAAAAAMRKCQADPLVIRIGRPYRPHSPGPSGRWTAVIYTKKMSLGPAPIPLVTCLRHSPAVTSASWPN